MTALSLCLAAWLAAASPIYAACVAAGRADRRVEMERGGGRR